MELLCLGVNLWCDAHCPSKPLTLLPFLLCSAFLSPGEDATGLVRSVSAEVTNVLQILYINILVLFLY